ncbi:hypothetical protein [Rhizobium leguminosarum]
MHYRRLLRHGDPLGGRTPDGEPLRFIQEVALRHTGDDCLTWPFCKMDNGYGQINIGGKICIVSRYVCELAHGAPPTPDHDAAHSCGKGHQGCIAPGHLIWKTRAQNIEDMLIHDTHHRGERNWNAKLKEAEVRTIINLKGIESQHNLAERFGVARGTVASIHQGKSWFWMEENR